MDRSDWLNSKTRTWSTAEMQAKELDLLVVGGGITGLGTALDAASRGLSVGLIEKGDLASGTSSKSSKMIHGGLRYLEQFRFKLVKESLYERGLLLKRIAPHLVRPVPFLYPLRRRFWERIYVGLGVALYDRLGGVRQLPRSRHLSRSEVAKLAPSLREENYVGGIQFWDAQADDARYALFVARTAASFDAKIATYVEADELIIEEGRVVGIRARDRLEGVRLEIRARHVACAAGVWTNKLLQAQVSLPFQIRPSKGVHLLLPRSAIKMDSGLLARTDTGLLFVIPWEDEWLVGDTDSDWDGDPDSLEIASADVGELLSRLNAVMVRPITRSEITGVFAGLRPLVAADGHLASKEVSRSHQIANPLRGLTVICGGKFTTYRRMASDLVDAVCQNLVGSISRRSGTESITLTGGRGYAELYEKRQILAAELSLESTEIERLLCRYGSCITEVISIIREDPNLSIKVSGTAILRAEVIYACKSEMALTIDDVMSRRTHLNDRRAGVIDEVAFLMQTALGWSDTGREREIERYRTSLTPKLGH
ncbi:FAD-dependent oxidoreductase [Rhizobium leguminosarum]|uniref:glycerol-3-phosphate dehydrogenase/oxidase n=1 Tax=Rhizobium leguminosarum TaxID=384 RepID=UPI003F9B7652